MIGGLNSPQFNGIDLNNDGIEDLVIYDRKGDVLLTFLYDGDFYLYRPEYANQFPAVRNYMLTYDYNCDGIKDLFCYPTEVAVDGIEAYTASYDANNRIQFTKFLQPNYVFDVLTYAGFSNLPVNIGIPRTDIPALEDIDNDGDMDVITFDFGGSWGVYYENQSADMGYGCDSMIFTKQSDCWGRFVEPANDINLFLSPRIDSCAGKSFFTSGGRPNGNTDEGDGTSGTIRGSRHAGSTMTAIDMDNDGDKEIILGDLAFSDLTLLNNGGNPDTAWITSQDINFPSNSVHAAILDFPAAFLLDYDHDGDRDMIAARNEDSDASENYNVAWYYENTGTETLPVFDFVENDFWVKECVDHGTYASPAFFDYNADGLLDIVIGNLGLFEPGGIQHGSLYLYENIGTVDTPYFRLVDEDYLNTSAYGIRRFSPAFGDVDNDGDTDLLLGEEFGGLHYFENTAGANNAPVFANPVFNYQNIDVVQTSIPQIIDVNRDGKNDLLIGQNQGFVKYFLNTSTTSTPVFTLQPAQNNSLDAWGDVDARPIGQSQGYAAPRLIDVNGTYELFVGNIDGKILHYTDIENNGNGTGTFTLQTDHYSGVDVGEMAIFDVADINNDGDLEFVIGNGRGGITIYSEGTIWNTVSVGNVAQANTELSIYPNPANQQLSIAVELSATNHYDLLIYNAIGQLIHQQNQQRLPLQSISTAHWNNGMYVVQIRTSTGETITKKVVVQH